MPRTTNAAGIKLIQSFESCKLDAYQDIRGIWTIGWGHTGGVTAGMTITQARADSLLSQDLANAKSAIVSGVGTRATTDNQFAAMVSLCFNIGVRAFLASTVLRQHRAGSFIAASAGFVMWNKATIDGVLTEVAGLTRRRSAERELYLTR